MPTRVRSFCKINLGLAVGPTRPDGFHGLMTVYQTLALHDFVTVTARRSTHTRITLEADHPGVPCTAKGDCDRNTAYKIVAGALQRLGLTAEVHMTIEKRLPVQGGLGAGSANAAAALLGLERELDEALPGADRLALAADVGSDVPLFLLGGTVLGLGRGEEVYPMPDGRSLPIVVAAPGVGVSTAQAFRDIDMLASTKSAQNDAKTPHIGTQMQQHLTPDASEGTLKKLSRVLASAWTPTGTRRETTGIASSPLQPSGKGNLLKSSGASETLHGFYGDLAENPLLALVRTGVENDFESVAFRQHPSLRDIKQALAEPSPNQRDTALYTALSGSGSALFGIYGSPEAASEAQRRLQALGTRAFLTETLSRPEYWRQMFA